MGTRSKLDLRSGSESAVAAAGRSLAGSADWIAALLLLAAVVAAVVSGTAGLDGVR